MPNGSTTIEPVHRPASEAFDIRNKITVLHPISNIISSNLVKKRPCESACINDRAGVYIGPYTEPGRCYDGQSGKVLCERLDPHEDVAGLGHSHNNVFKHVRGASHAIN